MLTNVNNTMIPTALYLIPVTLGDNRTERTLPVYNAEVIRSLRYFVVENLRSARRFLKLVDKQINIDELTFFEMGKHADQAQYSAFLKPLRQGESIGLLSEAGCPAVADPGAEIVRIAQGEGLKVVPLVGPSSILLAVMASGFNGQSFAFHGYLPIEATQRIRRLKQLETQAQSEKQTQLFIETPYRNEKLFKDILSACSPTTRLCVAAGLTTEAEWIKTYSLKEWKKKGLPDLSKIRLFF